MQPLVSLNPIKCGATPVAAPHIAPNGAQWAQLNTGDHHFQHGPIDLILSAQGTDNHVTTALHAAWQRFSTVLPELVSELPTLRQPLKASATQSALDQCFTSPVAQRMAQACFPYRQQFVTPMAAVAGAVADEILSTLRTVPLRRAFVNNGGDIALHLEPGEQWVVGLVSNPQAIRTDNGVLDPHGRFTIQANQGIGGIATSGWRGRSFSLGIADSVTVLAATAAQADVAATLIANAVTTNHPAIQRAPANTLKDDTDLGATPVTIAVGTLPQSQVYDALQHGVQVARHWQAQGLIAGAVLTLQGQIELVWPETHDNTQKDTLCQTLSNCGASSPR